MTIQEINDLDPGKCREEFQKCCGASNWVSKMMTARPFENEDVLLQIAHEKWFDCSETDWLEAFTHHPKIGDVESLEKKYASTSHLASDEQSAVNHASKNVINDLAHLNKLYEEKFTFIFIVCATGKTAPEMLELLKARINNSKEDELKKAAIEQNKITNLRLLKLINS